MSRLLRSGNPLLVRLSKMKYHKDTVFSMPLAIFINLILQGVSSSAQSLQSISESSMGLSSSTQWMETSSSEIASSTQSVQSISDSVIWLPSSTQWLQTSSSEIASSTQSVQSISESSMGLSSSTQWLQTSSSEIASSTQSVQTRSSEIASSTQSVRTNPTGILSTTRSVQTVLANSTGILSSTRSVQSVSASSSRSISTTQMPQTSQSPCTLNRCRNGGTCTVSGSTRFSCSCVLGYTGELCESETPFWSTMYPFGLMQNDSQLRHEQSLFYSYYHCLKIKTNKAGFPFFWKRHYKFYVCRNGIIQLNYEWSWWWPRRFGAYRWLRNMAIIAPFWAPVDMYWAFVIGRSKVYYHVYDKREDDPAAKDVLDMASDHVRQYQKSNQFAKFKAKWVAVVTWENLCPYTWYRYWYYEFLLQNTCQLSNTFQAVIITNGVNTFLMYNYPYGHIQWVVPASSNYYWWSGYYGLPVAGWNSGNDGRNYKNIEGSGTLYGMFDIDKRIGNTGEVGRYFWRIEDSIGKGAREACITWAEHQHDSGILPYYLAVMRKHRRFACPCSLWQAFFDRRFRIDWYSWPNLCAYSRRTIWSYLIINGVYTRVELKQQCCYSTKWISWGALKVGPHDGGHVVVDYPYLDNNILEEFSTDSEAYRLCCVHSKLCDVFYYFRRSDDCSLYRPPRRRWFWGDPHFNTLDGKNYTFNGIGEYVMVDAKEGFFQLQARTKSAQGNSTQATIFSAGAAQEENTSIVEVRVKQGGGIDVLINGTIYENYSTLTNESVEIGGDLFVSKPEENCLESSFPSSTSITFCEKKGMLSFVVTPSDDFKNATKGLLGTWNDDPDDDFTLPDGTALPASLTLRQIHFEFGVKWQINASQSLFTYGQGENASTFSDLSFEPMFADNITWQNDSFRVEAEATCGDDYACLFDAASTNDLSIGLVTKDINIQLVNETDQLENFPPKIVYAPDVINATIGETVEFNITAEDVDPVTFHVINKPDDATVNTTKYTLLFTWPVTSIDKINITFVLTDDKGASTDWTPSIRMCACQNNGSCISPEEDDELNTDSRIVYLGCACQRGYTGRLCDSDVDACESNGQPCYEGVECIDLPPSADTETGYECGPCPSGYTGDGAQCADINECDNATSHNCEQVCVNIPASFICDCYGGYQLNADRHRCDDINECVPSNDCMQQCANTMGSYNCSCNEYFKQDPADWKRCLPTNPCLEDYGCSHVCFLGENSQPACTCHANYELESDGKSCKDINECDPSKPLHRCDQICENTPGSYRCNCLGGFELHKDGFQCEDINECLSINTYNCTDEFHRCVNTRGSYRCECAEGLYWIDGKCKGLEKNQKPPEPSLPNPREPSEEEKQAAVEISLSSEKALKWDFETDKAFKVKTASVATVYCNDNRTKCGLPERRLVRRGVVLDDLYTADQVHLVPGYPRNSSVFLLVAFYVQKPPGYVTDVEAISSSSLLEIITMYKSDLEAAVGAQISKIQALFGPTLAPSQKTVEYENDEWKWIAIGLSAGTAAIILIIILVIRCFKEKKKKQSKVNPSSIQQNQAISMTQFTPALHTKAHADDMVTHNA